MKRKELESVLGTLLGFETADVRLEQYTTGPEIAASFLFTAQSMDDAFLGKSVADLGSGTGILSIGAALLGAQFVVGFEIDESAIDIAVKNVSEQGLENQVNFVQCDVTRSLVQCDSRFDTVVMNPPFGTKRNKGMDVVFLKEGLRIASDFVYSLHKTATRKHIMKKAEEWKVKAEVVAQLRFDLPRLYKFHNRNSVDIEVDFFKFSNLHNKRIS